MPAELLQLVGIAGVRGAVVDQDHGRSAVHLGIDGLVDEDGVGGEVLAGEDTVLIRLLRFVPQNQDQLAFDVKTGVVIVVILGRRDAIAGEHHLTLDAGRGGKLERDEVLAQTQRGAARAFLEFERIRRTQLAAQRDGKVLVVAFAVGRLHAELLVSAGQEGSRLFELGTARGAAAQFLRCQKLDVIQVKCRINGRLGGECQPCSHTESRQSAYFE